MNIFDRGIVFTNHKELVLNCDTELGRKCIKDLRILLLLFFTFLKLSKKDKVNNIITSEVGTTCAEAVSSITGLHIHETFSCIGHSCIY